MTKPTTSDMTVAEIIKGLCLDVDAYLNHEHMEQVKSEALAAIEAHYAAIRKTDRQELLDWVHHEARVKTAHNIGTFHGQYINVKDIEQRLNNTEEV